MSQDKRTFHFSAKFHIWKNEGIKQQSGKLLFGSFMNRWFGKGPFPPVMRAAFAFNFQPKVACAELVLVKLDHHQ